MYFWSSLVFIVVTRLCTGCDVDQYRCLTSDECLSGDEVCDGWPDCIDGSDEWKSSCNISTNGYFNCVTGGRIKYWQVCDGVHDCRDGSDEKAELCSEVVCHANQFKCKYGACLHGGSACDGVEDCADGSDEAKELCEEKQCHYNQFRCTDGRCVGMKMVCDGVQDCTDGSDELQPHCQNITDGLFDCGDGIKKEYWRVCDGTVDCVNRTDETEGVCGRDNCHGGHYQCEYGACLYSGTVCNGVLDCADGSDETKWLCSEQKCDSDEFRCGYGGCISPMTVCDGKQDCKDGSDESLPHCQNVTRGKFLCTNGKRIKAWDICDGESHCSDGSDEAQDLCSTFACHSNQFRCKYGACVGREPCNGYTNCHDGSDETEELCSNNKCKDDEYRCSYGGCVNKILVCDGKKDCADASDENTLLCQNATCFDHQFKCGYGACIKYWPCVEVENCTDPLLLRKDLTTSLFRCADGTNIYAEKVCDGENDCVDKSDEEHILCDNLEVHCAAESCQYRFPSSACDGTKNCLDGSDESLEMCNSLRCMLPEYPEHGFYNSSNPGSRPGDIFQSLSLTISCDEGFAVEGYEEVFCNNGTWSFYPLPKCIRYCTLENDPSISYRCVMDSETGESRACRERELSGTVALPTCNGPNYYSPHALPHMTCIEGSWDKTPNCSTECGKVTQVGVPLIANGRPAEHGEVPWYAGVYEKRKKFKQQICGGTLLNRNVVISAAHCFWGFSLLENKAMLLPAQNYAVAVGKLYRTWNHRQDKEAQKSDVSTILIPKTYEGSTKNEQADIALVFVATPFDYKPHIRPVCLSFDQEFDDRQLQPNNKGKIAGWGLTAPNSKKADKLNVVELPFVDTIECNERVPSDFREFITLDKFCAGYMNTGMAVCRGDSGSGLAFPETYDGVERHYLRGVASVSPRRSTDLNDCNIDAFTTMTSILKHENFIKRNF